MVNILKVYSFGIGIFQSIKCFLICLFLLFVSLQGSWLRFHSKSFFSCRTLCNLKILSYFLVHFRVCRDSNTVAAWIETYCTGDYGINKKLQWKSQLWWDLWWMNESFIPVTIIGVNISLITVTFWLCNNSCVCVCVCARACVRERERERETQTLYYDDN
jgi:hypothetical protein